LPAASSRDHGGGRRSLGELANDSQLRWLGPQKGVIHISMAAIINAVWDLRPSAPEKPGWKVLAGHDAARNRGGG
jgi:hypothetical protein